MTNNDGWRENTGNTWKPEKKDDEVVGILVDIEKEVGQNGSTMYTVEEAKTHETVSIWGSAILDSRMKGINIGEEVRVVYKGLGDKKPGKNPPKLWQVFHRDPEVK
jgi:hypothetical protein